MINKRDREPGLRRDISRRDFLKDAGVPESDGETYDLVVVGAGLSGLSLIDSFWLDGGSCTDARRPFGRIAIASADSEAYSYTDAALDRAERAVREILAQKG